MQQLVAQLESLALIASMRGAQILTNIYSICIYYSLFALK